MPIQQKGFAQILILILLLVGIGVGVYLVQQKTNLSPKAYSKPPITTEARFYPDVKTKLLAGDLLTMPAVRQSSDSAMTADHWKFQKAISALNAVNKNEIGVKKGIFLSAVDDVTNLISAIPADVDWVIYNMEPGMTPSSDLADPVASVKQFANIVRSSGRKMGFAPMRTHFDQYQGTSTMTEVLNSIDLVYYQGQLLLLEVGEDAFVQTVQEKYAYVKSVNPNVEFHLQLWLVRQTPQEMISAFNRLTSSMDNAVIGAASGLDLTSQVLEVLSGLSWRQQSTPTPTPTPTITPTPTPSIFTNLSVELSAKKAIFSFNYQNGFASTQSLSAPENLDSSETTKISKFFTVDISTSAGMLLDTKANFGWGKDSPITVHNPQGRWGSYRCGTVLYWRVYSPGKAEQSPIQNSRVVCEQQPL